MRGTRHNPYIAEKVKAMTEDGFTARQIAAEVHVTIRTVTRYRERLGISQPHNGDHTLTDRDRAKAIDMFEDGCSAAEVARTLGFSPSTITKHFPGRQWNRQQCGEWSWAVRKVAI